MSSPSYVYKDAIATSSVFEKSQKQLKTTGDWHMIVHPDNERRNKNEVDLYGPARQRSPRYTKQVKQRTPPHTHTGTRMSAHKK